MKLDAMIKIILSLVTYGDGKVHWRRLAAVVLCCVLVFVVDAFKSELLAAHVYGDVKNAVGVLLTVVSAVVGRDVKPAPPQLAVVPPPTEPTP